MTSKITLVLVFLSFIPRLFCFNALLVSIGQAGHVIPLFELAKSLKNHNITFVTQPLAKSYINFDTYSNSSSFHVIYTNDSLEALQIDKQKVQDLISYTANHSFFDMTVYASELLREDMHSLLNTTIHLLMNNQYDVIIANSLVSGISVIAKQAQIPCIVQSTESLPNLFNFNFPNIFSSLSREHMTQIPYRIYNVIYTLRLSLILLTKMLPSASKMSESFPKVPGSFYDIFSMRNFLFNTSKCLELSSIPPSFHIPSYTDPYKKYLGAFIDETTIRINHNELTDWIQSKPDQSIIYGAFGTSSLIKYNRMKNLVVGLAEFLFQTSNSFLLLVLHGDNYPTYQKVLNEIDSKESMDILMNNQRVQIVNTFVEQKWILQQKSIKIFVSHCGMGSCSEGIFFHKPILCMPFNMDQFMNAMTIDHLNIGLSLFSPPSLFQSLLKPYDFQNYNFSSTDVTRKLLKIWSDADYQKMSDIMSKEMKYTGGLKRAREEIEFFVDLNGDFDRYIPLQDTLPFYQRYMLDLLIIFIILPGFILIYTLQKYRRNRQRKQKKD